MTNSEIGVVPFLLLYAEALPAPKNDTLPAEPPSLETRFTRAERETTDDD
ncbi:MAG TPA: hypothetical protein VFR85_15655 [Anaeromyxobacteraceae bacterium]|nr:hypothetical protein [Anaeromyxobacteraceae bacterium]